MKKTRLLLIATLCFSLPASAHADTIVSEPISDDTVWVADAGPYVAEEGLVILEGATLTIGQGVDVRTAGSIVVLGDMIASGIEESPVRFSGAEDGAEWGGMYFVGGESSSLSHVEIAGASGGIYAEDADVEIANATLSGLDAGLVAVRSSFLFEDVIAEEWGDGFSFSDSAVVARGFSVNRFLQDAFGVFGSSTADLSDFSFFEPGGGAAFFAADTSSLALSDGVVVDSSSGDVEVYGSASVEISNVAFSGAGDISVRAYGNANLHFDDVSIQSPFDGAVDLHNASEARIADSALIGGLSDGVSAYNQSSVSIEASSIRGFLGAGIVAYNESVVSVTESEIAENTTGVLVYAAAAATVSISQSSIAGNLEYGLIKYSDASVSAADIWWGHSSGPVHAAIPDGPPVESMNPDGEGDAIAWVGAGGVSFLPFLARPPGPLDPVIIIPGIMGSWQKDGEWVLDPILHVYDDLIATLDANAYDLGVDLFPFPYEWRDSNVQTAILLKEKIDEIKALCGCDKVDLVAHSMGGLVARQYVQSDAYEDDVDQLIFLGTPHLGSPEAYVTWEGGEFPRRTVIDPRTIILQMLFDHEARKNGHQNLYLYIRGRPILSLQELLPIYPYLRDAASGELKQYPIQHPRNSFLETLADSVNVLLESSIRITNIIGDNQENDTINSIRVTIAPDEVIEPWLNGYPENFGNRRTDQGLERGRGDKTVPHESASFIEDGSVVVISDHQSLPDKAQEIVFRNLAGQDPDTVILNENKTDVFMLIRVFSPVDIQITAPDGSRLGANFETGEDYDEIPGAFYSGNDTDAEFAIIFDPLPGEYEVAAMGTGEGEYAVSVSYADEEHLVESSYGGFSVGGEQSSISLSLVVDDDGSPAVELGSEEDEAEDISQPSGYMPYLVSVAAAVNAPLEPGSIDVGNAYLEVLEEPKRLVPANGDLLAATVSGDTDPGRGNSDTIHDVFGREAGMSGGKTVASRMRAFLLRLIRILFMDIGRCWKIIKCDVSY